MNRGNDIFVLGFNHNTANFEQRSQLNVDLDAYETLIRQFEHKDLESITFLNTCNRSEFYVYGSEKLSRALYAFLLPSDEWKDQVFYKKGQDAIRHLFKVSAGLDSQLLGDLEILGQFKTAFKQAKEQDRLSGYMERLANTCIQSAKEIRSKTALTSGTSSLSYACIQLLMENKLDANAKILLIGIGKFGKSIAKNIRKYLPDNPLTLTNRTSAKSEALAAEIHCDHIAYEELKQHLDQYDVLISAIGKTGLKIEAQDFQSPSAKVLVDLSVPALFDEQLRQTEGFQLFTIEDTSKVVNDSLEQRKSSVPIARSILGRYQHEFVQWSYLYAKSDCIKEWKNTIENVSHVCPHFKAMSEDQRSVTVKKSVGRFVQYIKKDERFKEEDHLLLSDFAHEELDEECTLQCTTLKIESSDKCNSCQVC